MIYANRRLWRITTTWDLTRLAIFRFGKSTSEVRSSPDPTRRVKTRALCEVESLAIGGMVPGSKPSNFK